ncbi:MAG: nitroreductase family protein [Chloroflexi bacterium]|nr:nitroreductase family protein [Chloroflexota bacterium]
MPDQANVNIADVVMNAIKSRRSIRKYTGQEVTDETIRLILEAARWAPSGENSQGWRFIVVRDAATKKRLNELATGASGRQFSAEYLAQKMERRFETLKDPSERQRIFKSLTSGAVSDFMNEATVIICVCGRREVWDLPFDNSAATENLLLMASALGLGACWVIAPFEDVRDEELANQLLHVPRGYKLITTVTLGYPARIPGPRPRKPLDELVFYERFGNVDQESKTASFNVTPGPAKSPPSDYLNDLIFDIEKNFWIERGGGTRFRTPTIGWTHLERHKERLSSGGSVAGCVDVVREFLKENGVVDQFDVELGNSTVLDGSVTFSHIQTAEICVRGCAHLSIEREMVEAGLEPYVCPCANAFSYAVRRVEGIWAELAAIKIDQDRCTVKQVLLLPKYIDGARWS